MKEYIDKSALVAEIEKVTEEPAPSHDQQCPWEDGYYCGLYKAESIIDTLEVKEEVNTTDAFIEKACEWIEDNLLTANQLDNGYINKFRKAMEE